MDNTAKNNGLTYPFPEAPEPARPLELADGVFWLRMPLPFRLDPLPPLRRLPPLAHGLPLPEHERASPVADANHLRASGHS